VAVVAVRLLRLRMLSRQAPDTPARATVPQEVVAVLAGRMIKFFSQVPTFLLATPCPLVKPTGDRFPDEKG
jgi:hypothetical protein